MTTGVRRIRTDDDLERAFDVRFRVFVDEQGVDPDLEIDDHENEAIHFLAWSDGSGDDCQPVGTARLREPEPGVGKVERVAVLQPHREDGWGRKLLTAVEETARERGIDRLELHSQTRVTGFYLSLGYEPVGEQFMEANIPHVKMIKSLQE